VVHGGRGGVTSSTAGPTVSEGPSGSRRGQRHGRRELLADRRLLGESVAAGVDVSVTKTDGLTTVAPGQVLTYTIVVLQCRTRFRRRRHRGRHPPVRSSLPAGPARGGRGDVRRERLGRHLRRREPAGGRHASYTLSATLASAPASVTTPPRWAAVRGDGQRPRQQLGHGHRHRRDGAAISSTTWRCRRQQRNDGGAFTASLSQASSTTVTVAYATADGTAQTPATT